MNAQSFNAYAKRAPRRLAATIPDNVFQKLNALALEQGRSVSNLAAFLLEASLAAHQLPPSL